METRTTPSLRTLLTRKKHDVAIDCEFAMAKQSPPFTSPDLASQNRKYSRLKLVRYTTFTQLSRYKLAVELFIAITKPRAEAATSRRPSAIEDTTAHSTVALSSAQSHVR